MSKLLNLSTLVLLSLPFTADISAVCTNSWNTTSGNWGSAGQTTNWTSGPACVPGLPGTGNMDEADFNVNGGGTVIISLQNLASSTDVSPNLNIIQFNSVGTSYLIQQGAAMTGQINIVGTTPFLTNVTGSQQITAPISLNTDTLTITVEGAGDTLTLSGLVTDAGTSSISVSANGGTPNLGTVDNTNNTISVNGSFSFNTGVSDTGTFINNNNLSVASGNFGSEIALPMTGNFTINAGTFQNNNSGDVSYTGAGLQSVGSGINILGGDLTFNGGHIENNNTGTPTSVPASGEPPGSIGSQIFIADGNFLMTAGTLDSINQAPLTSANVAGCFIFVDMTAMGTGNFQISGAGTTVNIENTAALTFAGNTGDDTSYGSALFVKDGTIYDIGAGATLNFINSGPIQNGYGVSASSENPAGTVEGTLNFTNTGTVTTSMTSFGTAYGVQGQFELGLTLSAPGSINLLNTGTITNNSVNSVASVGVFVNLLGPYIQNGGSFTNNSIQVASPIPLQTGGSVLSAITIPLISPNAYSINGGTFLNNATIIGISMGNSILEITGTPSTTKVSGNGNFVATSGDFSVINNGGTFEPGDRTQANPGTMTLGDTAVMTTGSYTQNSGLYNAILIDTGHFGSLECSNATLSGPIQIEGLPGVNINPGDTFVLINAPDAVVGTFSPLLTLNLPAGLIPHLTFTPTQVILSFLLSGAACPSLTSFIGAFPETLFSSITNINLRIKREFQKLQEKLHVDCDAPAKCEKKQSRSSRVATRKNIAQPLKIGSLSPQFADNHDETDLVSWGNNEKKIKQERAICEANRRPWNVYLGPIASTGETSSKGNQVGYDFWSAGILGGFDYAFNQVGVGVLGNFERIHGDVHHHWGKFDINQAHASIYATYTPAPLPELAFDGIVGGGYEWYRFKRDTIAGRAKGTPHGSEFDALFGLEYTFANRQFSSLPKGLQIIPMALAQFVYLDVDKYTESGAEAQNLIVNSHNAKSLSTIAGAFVNYTWDWTDFAFTVKTDIAWQREYFTRTNSLHYVPADLSELGAVCPLLGSLPGQTKTATLKLPNAPANTLLAGVDLLFSFFNRYELEASYDFQWNKMFHDNYFYLGFNAKF